MRELGVDGTLGCGLAFSFPGDLALFSFQRRKAGLDLALATKYVIFKSITILLRQHFLALQLK
jgi:hypothetical protein